MKGQDIGILLKLLSLQKQGQVAAGHSHARNAWPDDRCDWEPELEGESADTFDLHMDNAELSRDIESRYTVRALAQETGISKSQINIALNRCIAVGLAKKDRKTGLPKANAKALFEFIIFGLKYVFPAKTGELTRGIATSFVAPVLNQKLMSAGELSLVWPDAKGSTKGLSVEPLFTSVTYAVKRDPEMYALLALIDAIRIGQPREVGLATGLLKQHLEL